MRKEHGFAKAEAYNRHLCSPIEKASQHSTGADSIGHFNGISKQLGVAHQRLIHLDLRDGAAHNRNLDLSCK